MLGTLIKFIHWKYPKAQWRLFLNSTAAVFKSTAGIQINSKRKSHLVDFLSLSSLFNFFKKEITKLEVKSIRKVNEEEMLQLNPNSSWRFEFSFLPDTENIWHIKSSKVNRMRDSMMMLKSNSCPALRQIFWFFLQRKHEKEIEKIKNK